MTKAFSSEQAGFDILTDEVLEGVRQGGELALTVRKDILGAKIKSSKDDLVTDGDKAVSEHLQEVFSKAYSGITFMDEEVEGSHTLDITNEHIVAVVDPIDGTGNYYRGYLSPDQASPDWGVSVGIIRDGKVAAGIIYQPQTKALYFAERGKGAFMNDEKIHVSDQCEVRGDVLTGDSPYPHDKVSYAAYGKAVERYSQELGVHIEQLGSQVIDAMLVARGKKAGFLHFQTKPWDIAAAISIVTEAGGKVMDIFGQEYTLFEKTVLMTNGTLDIEEITKIAREELATATN